MKLEKYSLIPLGYNDNSLEGDCSKKM
jgi:hypothetical protein